jgi:hypothetical protein
MITEKIKYELIISTNKYAGNFERQLCAHVTGQVGDCEVGEEFVEDDIQEMFEDIVEGVYQEGYSRPCAIGFYSKVPGVTNNDVIIYFYNNPTDEMLKTVKERVSTFANKYKELNPTFSSSVDGLEIIGIRLVQKVITTKLNTFTV